MNLREWFDRGLTRNEYEAGMTVNREEMNAIYDRFQLADEQKEVVKDIKEKGLNVIVLTEDWCGDAMLNNPILLKIAEEAGMEVRFVLRDENLELMDQYLTNGTSRAIPIFIFINQEGEEKTVWGPRAVKLQELVVSERSKLPDQESPDFKDKQKEMYRKLVTSYKEDENIWNEVANDIIGKLKSI